MHQRYRSYLCVANMPEEQFSVVTRREQAVSEETDLTNLREMSDEFANLSLLISQIYSAIHSAIGRVSSVVRTGVCTDLSLSRHLCSRQVVSTCKKVHHTLVIEDQGFAST